MKRFFSALAVVFALGLCTVVLDAEAAKRLGSGKSLGTQRQATSENAPTNATNSTPTSNTTAAAPATTAAPGAASPGRSWMGPVAGLAAGLGLAALASHFGFGDELATMVMMGLLAAAVMAAIGLLLRKRAGAQSSSPSAPLGMTYARVNSGAEPFASNRAAHEIRSYQVSMPAGGRSGIDTRGDAVSRIPADFDRAGFERNAKLQFIRLQAANDARDLDDIRQFTTPEMFAELKLEIAERGTSPQKTEVVGIQAEVLEVDQDPQRYLVSVRFTGVCTVTIGVGAAEPDEPFNEIWHLTKPRQGDGGWVLCGIQQLD